MKWVVSNKHYNGINQNMEIKFKFKILDTCVDGWVGIGLFFFFFPLSNNIPVSTPLYPKEHASTCALFTGFCFLHFIGFDCVFSVSSAYNLTSTVAFVAVFQCFHHNKIYNFFFKPITFLWFKISLFCLDLGLVFLCFALVSVYVWFYFNIF